MSVRNLYALMVLGLLSTAASYAAPTSCAPPPPPSQVVDTDPSAGPSSFTFTCGGLTFSNFEVADAGAVLPVIMDLHSATFDPLAGTVVLNFNPNLSAVPGTKQDIHFYFQVSGNVNAVDLGVGGTNSTITERVCATAINRDGGNICTGGLANQLAAITNFSGRDVITAGFADRRTASPIYIFKDILADGRFDGGAELTSFSQSFHTSAVPEPMSMGLMGSGLGVLALLRRKKA